jgi:hypothetical protein
MKKLLIIPLFLFSFYSYSQDVIWSKIASKNNVDIYLRYNIQQCSIFNLLYKHHDLFENIDCETKMKIINETTSYVIVRYIVQFETDEHETKTHKINDIVPPKSDIIIGSRDFVCGAFIKSIVLSDLTITYIK